MNVIRDEHLGGIAMIPLFCDWGVRRCNVAACPDRPTTILTQLGTAPDGTDIPIMGLCEPHYQEMKARGMLEHHCEWDDYDAFAAHDVARRQEGAS